MVWVEIFWFLEIELGFFVLKFFLFLFYWGPVGNWGPFGDYLDCGGFFCKFLVFEDEDEVWW